LGATARVNLYHQLDMHYYGTPYTLTGAGLAQMTIESTGWVTNGLQLQIDHKVRDGWRWGANYTYERLHEHFDWGLRNIEPVHKLNASVGYGQDDWAADLYGFYSSSTRQTAATPENILSPITYITVPHVITLSPHLSWRPAERVTLDLTADHLWPYRDTVGAKTEVTYFLSAKFDY
jgi:hypothetical protein